MKTIKEQIKSLFNGVVSIEKYNDCYIVSTKMYLSQTVH